MIKNRILVVTGMHRSGTSLITQWLHRCGLQVGDELLGADTGNDNGHFEDLDFLDCHKAILKAHRLSDNGFTPVPLQPLSYEEKDRLRDIVSWKNDFYQQWGWKDPRTCLFLEVYKELLPEAFYFVVLRDFQPVVSSLVHRMYKQKEKKYAAKKGISAFIWKHFIKKNKMEQLRKKYCQRLLQVWLHYNQCILQHIKQLPDHQFIVADYTILRENDQLVFDHLVNRWGFNMQFCSFKDIYQPGQLNQPFNIEPYIKDKSLLIRAVFIEASLKQKAMTGYTRGSSIAV